MKIYLFVNQWGDEDEPCGIATGVYKDKEAAFKAWERHTAEILAWMPDGWGSCVERAPRGDVLRDCLVRDPDKTCLYDRAFVSEEEVAE